MQKVILEPREEIKITEESVPQTTPIFAKKNDKLCGMVIYIKHEGWILKLGGSSGADGYHETRRECLISASRFNYEFFIEG